MACFTVPLAEALVASAVRSAKGEALAQSDNPFLAKFGWLQKLAFGGSFLLAIEHVWHGEIIPAYPFLSAVRDGDTAGMLHEMATNGVAMAALVTIVWAGMVLVSTAVERSRSAAKAEV